MQPYSILRNALFLMLVTFGLSACKSQFVLELEGEKAGRNARIELFVDAEELFDKSKLDLEDCALWDGVKGNVNKGNSVKDFESTVYDKNMVTWRGSVDSDSRKKGYSIKILQIEMDPEKNCVFDKVVVAGKSGMVKAKVKKRGEDDCISPYSIWFELENPDGNTRVFRLDPFLRAIR